MTSNQVQAYLGGIFTEFSVKATLFIVNTKN